MEREVWDAYDREGNPLGFDLVRGEAIPQGVYHLVVEVLAAANDGRVLLTRRHPDKAWGGLWEYTGGSVLKGETPVQGALRELREERGIIVPPQDLHPVYVDTWPETAGMGSSIYHSFITFFNPSEQALRLQAGETVDYELLPYETFLRVLTGERFVDVLRRRFLDHREDFDRILTEHFN